MFYKKIKSKKTKKKVKKGIRLKKQNLIYIKNYSI